jgi:hypothetical protein
MHFETDQLGVSMCRYTLPESIHKTLFSQRPVFSPMTSFFVPFENPRDSMRMAAALSPLPGKTLYCASMSFCPFAQAEKWHFEISSSVRTCFQTALFAECMTWRSHVLVPPHEEEYLMLLPSGLFLLCFKTPSALLQNTICFLHVKKDPLPFHDCHSVSSSFPSERRSAPPCVPAGSLPLPNACSRKHMAQQHIFHTPLHVKTQYIKAT